jgi:hypothetical protein
MMFALLCGIATVPALALLPYQWGWAGAFKIILTIYLGVYALLLCRWSQTHVSGAIYPLLLVAGAALYPSGLLAFLLIGLAVLSWIRSGICYPAPSIRKLIGEVALITGGIVLALAWPPLTPLAAGLGCWLFFLVQSLYFFGLADPKNQDRDKRIPDRFEQISRDMERILADHQTPAG